ncbi:hemolysin family protein [Fluviibacterium sp. DFM31]|uniref:Hemolysin family protein n=1 Tax=Meridianimarinicoccus marinus TaxID=3231483 RepID=A0ABV3L2P8_9RHOB
MNDADGSSPETADSQDDQSSRWGLLGRVFSRADQSSDDHPKNGHAIDAGGPKERPGLSNLRRMQISDVAVPKAEITAVPMECPLNDLVDLFRDSGYSRLPVYDGTLDSPIGMVHLKDVALKHGFDCDNSGFDLRDLVRPLIYAPPSMPIGVLLQKMQTQRTHMALVIDEYGGTDGLVTLEDLIEQVIGEIEDEHDEEEVQPWTEEAPGTFVALARAPLDEFSAAIGVDLHMPDVDEDIDTLGGVVFLLMGRVPARGEVLKHPAGVEIEVVDADPRRIKRLRIRTPNSKPDAG